MAWGQNLASQDGALEPSTFFFEFDMRGSVLRRTIIGGRRSETDVPKQAPNRSGLVAYGTDINASTVQQRKKVNRGIGASRLARCGAVCGCGAHASRILIRGIASPTRSRRV